MFKVQKVDNAKVILDERVGKLSWVVCGEHTPCLDDEPGSMTE